MNDHKNFYEKCYELVKSVPEGKVTTYGEIARALDSKAVRAVGTAMAKNPYLFVVPCHRVVRSDGSIGQYALGVAKKEELLLQEGLEINNGKIENFANCIYQFNLSS